MDFIIIITIIDTITFIIVSLLCSCHYYVVVYCGCISIIEFNMKGAQTNGEINRKCIGADGLQIFSMSKRVFALSNISFIYTPF